MAKGRYKRRSQMNWGFVVVVSVLAAAAVLVTFSEPLGIEGVPTWEQILAEPERTGDKSSAPENGETESAPEDGEPSRIGVTVHIIDVGQGDSILIETEIQSVLIDAGPAEAQQDVIAYLRGQNVTKLDLVIATHPHADHVGGMAEVVKKYPVGTIIMPEVPEGLGAAGYSYEKLLAAVAGKGLRLTKPRPGDRYDLGGAELTILGPVEADPTNMNNNSVVARLDCGDTSFLFTGDSEREAERSLLAAGADLSADVLKAGHHGSKTSSSSDFLREVNPRLAAISCGWDNSYGHPHRDMLSRLERVGASVWRTDMDGTVIFKSDGAEITVSSESERENAA